MKLFIGLGNPGGEYRHHRHNVGFMAVDEIHAQYSFSPWRSRFHGLTSEGQLGGQKCLLLKPATHMNESGRSAGEAVRFFKLETEDVTVFHDELDLAPGKLRVKTGGGHAGHNGLRSLDSHIGPEYQRVRIGIGHPGRKDLVHRYVLHNFAKSDLDWLVDMLDEIARAAEYLAIGDAARFQNEVARHLRPDDKSKQQIASDNKPAPDLAKNQAKPHKWQMVSDTPQSADDDTTSVASDEKNEGSLAAKLRKWMKSN